MKRAGLLVGLLFGMVVVAQGPLMEGFNTQTFERNDDESIMVDFGFQVDFFGLQAGLESSPVDSYLNNNGNVTFGDSYSEYAPEDLGGGAVPAMIAPFWADVDTRDQGMPVQYGTGNVDGRPAWGATFKEVGGYGLEDEVPQPLNTFQLLIVDRSDIAPGDFDIYYLYKTIEWDVGTASDGQGPVVGYVSAPDGEGGQKVVQLDGSTEPGVFLDGGTRSLAETDYGDGDGVLILQVRGGDVSPLPASNMIHEAVARAVNAVAVNGRASRVRRLAKMFRVNAVNPPVARRGPKAGGIDELELSLEGSYTSFDVDGLGDGDAGELVGTIAATMGKLGLGLNLTAADQDIDDLTDVEIKEMGLEFFSTYSIIDELTVNCFVGYTQYDVEDAATKVGGGIVTTPGEDFGRWSAGLGLGYTRPVGPVDVGLSGMVASTNKSSFSDILDQEDSLMLAMIDVGKDLSDHVRAQVFAQYVNYFDTSTNYDPSYWVLIGEMTYAPNDRWVFGLGYETTVKQDDYDGDTVRLTASFLF